MGVILYQLLTDQLPFDSPSAIGLVLKHQSEAPAPPSSVRPGISARLEDVCLRALEKSAADRYQTAREFRAALRGAVDVAPGSYARESGPSVNARVPPPAPSSGSDLSQARTELRRVAAPTMAAPIAVPVRAALAPTQASPVAPAESLDDEPMPELRSRPRWPLILGVAAVLVLAGGVAALRGTWSADAKAGPASATPSAASPGNARGPASQDLPEGASRVGHEAESANQAVLTTNNGATLARGTNHVREPAVAKGASMPVDNVAGKSSGTALVPSAPSSTSGSHVSFNAATADVVIGSAQVSGAGVAAGTVNEALAHVKGGIVRCYRTALPALAGTPGSVLQGTGTLHIETDEEGHVAGSNVQSAVAGTVPSCIANFVVSRVTLATGESARVVADIPLDFRSQ